MSSHRLTVVAIDASGHGDRPPTRTDVQARHDIRQAVAAGDHEWFRSTSIRYAISLAERAVPEWRATLDALEALPEFGTGAPVGYGGGITLGTAIEIPLTSVEPRITAAIFGGGFFAHDALLAAAYLRSDSVPAPVG